MSDKLPIVLGIRCYPAGGSDLFIQSVIEELQPYILGTVVTITEGKPWNGPTLPYDQTVPKIATIDPNAIIYSYPWKNEIEQGNALLDYVYNSYPGAYIFIADTDEVTDISTVKAGLELIKQENADVCRFYQKIYWKKPLYVLQPDLMIQTIGLVRMDQPRRMGGLRHIADINKEVILPFNHGVMHHMSYVRDDRTVKEKLACFSHANEIIPNWYDTVWKKWDQDHNLCNLHPLNPTLWTHVEIQHPAVLPKSLRNHITLQL